MNFVRHSNLEGLHAPFSASQPYWLWQDFETNKKRYISRWIPTVGTVSHAFAKVMIEKKIKLSKSDMKMYKLYLLENKVQCIPYYIVDNMDLQSLFLNLIPYINDAIGFRMTPEQILYYSDRWFGTADSISFFDNILRIHDLKTGKIAAKMEQLMVYAALFCLEYRMKPGTINMELRLYQNNEVIVYNPTAEDILPIMDQIKTQDELFKKMVQEEN